LLRSLAAFEATLPNAVATQERVLAGLLAGSTTSRFGRDFGLASIRNYADFVRQVPILDYDKLKPYLDPIGRGDVSGVFNPGTKVHMLAMTSGTSGAAKFLPVTDRYLANYRRAWNSWGVACYRDHMDAWLRPILQISAPMDDLRSECDLPCGAISGFIFRHQLAVVRKFYVLPACVGYIKNSLAKCYTIMRLAIGTDVGAIVTANPSTPLQLAQTAERFAEPLIRDIRDGTLRADLEIDPAIRAELTAMLKPDLETAARLNRLASSRGRLLPKDYWKPGYLANWTGGTLGLYLRQFPEYFGDVPVRDLGLIASEGRMSLPLSDGTSAGVLEILGNFYEFVPVDEIASPAPTVLRCHELQAGQDYFVLLTTGGGLFRYHIGDVVRCEGFEPAVGGQAPIIRFLNKGQNTSSLTGEKLTEHQAVLAVGRAAERCGLAVQVFVLCPRWSNPPFYALNIEPSSCPSTRANEFAAAIDSELAGANVEYTSKRSSGRLGPVIITPVAEGFFEQLQQQRVLQRGTRREQYKHQFLYAEVDADKDFPRPPAPPQSPGEAAAHPAKERT
jgi:hypothetical protein